ncbi:MAG TPA: hypothetical protein VLG12_01025 [Candidatus Saccharimonadales bacterium]|nr:hypothetical protein [Candidatus Saccharimonadales bacterium]
MDHVYVSGNNQHNVWSQWWGSSSDGSTVVTTNFWWQGYTYVQWRLFGWQENHAYYWINPANGSNGVTQVNVC